MLVLFAALVIVHGPAESADYSGRARVIDGDTISIRNQRIRIAAIDACERDQTGLKDGKVWGCGVAARSYLGKMIDGQHVGCDIIDQDQYRRLVGQCFIGDVDIGLAMVKAGLAEAML
ncbi:thermonuclease family protein, partial [Sinorhizobium meliloti]|nr:thermonuclease family protein [Sinorhizobium meliloti]MDX0035920.1 thermonuclease family protein [Sinorhizobium meliloti]